MYVRPPDPTRQRIKIPDNYSGHAFKESDTYSDMPPPLRVDLPPNERREEAAFTKENLEKALPNENTVEKDDFDLSSLKKSEKTDDFTLAAPSSAEKSNRSSIFSSLLPSSASMASHFPFGHGIGSEEILILAMMLLVFLSGEGESGIDNELLLLLGLLLFAG